MEAEPQRGAAKERSEAVSDTGWTITLDADTVEGYDPDQLGEIEDTLAQLSAIVTGPTAALPHRFGVTLSIDGTSLPAAIDEATTLIEKAAAGAGMPAFTVAHVDAMTYSEHDRTLEETDDLQLVGVTEVAEILGVSRQRASELRKRPGFPTPVAELASGPVWTRPLLDLFVEHWERKRGRPKLSDGRQAAVKAVRAKKTRKVTARSR
jgi:hypothetical protein